MSVKNHLCIHFEKDNTYTIIKDDSGKLKNSKKANVKNEATGKWEVGDIVYRDNLSIKITIDQTIFQISQ